MENPRPGKVAVVDEVRSKFEAADAVLLTEYRGLKVAELAQLRSTMRGAGGEYRVYKNTLVRRAVAELDLDLADQLTGPTAVAFVTAKADGSPGDIAAVAKAISEFAKGNPLLVVKGGVLGDKVLDAAGAKALASLPSASEVYSRLAGALNSGARGLAGVVSGIHRSLALVLSAAAEAGAFAGDAPVAASDPAADAPAPEADAAVDADTAPAPEAEAAPAADASADEPAADEAAEPVAVAAEPEPAADAAPESEEPTNVEAEEN